MSGDKLEQILTVVGREMPGLMSKLYHPDCCIAATRHVGDVLEHFGAGFVAWPCRLLAANHVFAAMADRLTEPPGKEEAERCFQMGGWSIGVGFPARPTKAPSKGKGWFGHLVALAGGRFLIDASLGQASRPEKGMLLEETVFGLPCDFDPSEPRSLEIKVPQPKGVPSATLLYYPQPENRAYLESPDWLKPRYKRDVSTALIGLVEKVLSK